MTRTTAVLPSDRSTVTAALEAGVRAIIEGDAFRAYLDTQAAFHRYSFNNVVLLLHQRPDATRVAGYRTWQKLGRQVRKGEKGMKIFVPYTRRRATEEEGDSENSRSQSPIFGLGTVFDVSQTDGEPLPEPPSLCDLTGESDSSAALTVALTGYLASQSITTTSADILPGGARGSWDPTQKVVTIRAGMSVDQTAKTLAHEAAHALAGHVGGKVARDDAEAVAECAAYLVCAHHGIDTGAYSFGYVAAWAEDMAVFTRNIGSARAVAASLIDGLAVAPASRAREEDIALAA